MRIVVPCIGSRGDVQPYINLCQGLKEAGHEVTVATNPTTIGLATSHGLSAVPVGRPVDMGAAGARLLAQSLGNMWIGMIRVMQLGAQLVEEAYPDVLAAVGGSDLVITSDTGSGAAEAARLGIPWISVTLQPARIPTIGTSASAIGRGLRGLMGRLFVAPTNRFRRRVGAPAVTDMDDLMSTRLILLPVSPLVAPTDTRWPRHVCQTGYWFAREQAQWVPPNELLAFLEDGEQPIAVTLGVMSMSGRRAKEAADIVLEALEATNARAVLQGWDEALRAIEIPKTVFHAGAMPHRWLFDRVTAVIHHGGFGTTAATLRSGVPGIIIPHVIDQFYWGQRVHQLGVSPRPIPRAKLSRRSLSEAIVQARGNRPLRDRASDLGRGIRGEIDGVSQAVRAIETLL